MFRNSRHFVLLVWLLVVADIVLENVNGRFWVNDFRVYYMAADAFIHHRPVYGEVFGEDTGLFKYAPVVLFLFVPYALLPFKVAAVVHLLLSALILTVCSIRIERILMRHVFGIHRPRVGLRTVIGLLCIAALLVRELHVGNINLWLLLLIVIATEARSDGDRWLAGICIGMAAVIKPYLLLLLVAPLVRRERALVLGALSAIALGAMIPLVLGPHQWFTMHEAWLSSMQRHVGTLESFNTLSTIIGHAFHFLLPPIADLAFFFVAAISIAILVWRSSITSSSGAGTVLELWIPLALVPNLVITDQEHFMFALPLISFTLAYLFGTRDRIVLVLFIVAMALYATRSSDLWGSALFDRMEWHGALGIGNLMLVGTACIAWYRWRRERAT